MRNKMRWLFPEMALAFKTLIAIGVLTLAFCAGTHVSPVAFEPQTTAVIEPRVESRLVATHTIQYVDRSVAKVKYVERVKRVPVELCNFSDLEELKQWLEDKKNVTIVRFQSPDTTVDCDDYALEMQQKALADGYIMSFEVIGRSEYNALFKTELPLSQSLHAINLVIIGNDAYYIEPQTDEVVFATHLD